MVVAAAAFVVYARARMQGDERREKLYLKIHYTALFVVVLLGIIYLLLMVKTAD
jgi:hypothetical protein